MSYILSFSNTENRAVSSVGIGSTPLKKQKRSGQSVIVALRPKGYGNIQFCLDYSLQPLPCQESAYAGFAAIYNCGEYTGCRKTMTLPVSPSLLCYS